MDGERTLPFRSRKKTAEAMAVLLVWVKEVYQLKRSLKGVMAHHVMNTMNWRHGSRQLPEGYQAWQPDAVSG